MWWVELLNSFVSVLDSGGAGGGAGAFESIATITASGGESSLSLTSIPSTYKHLQVRMTNRFSASAPNYGQIRLNSDSGANYAWYRLYGNGTSAATSAATGSSYTPMGWSAGSATGASTFGVAIVDIIDYASTTKYKTMRSIAGCDGNTASTDYLIQLASALWLSTSAVTSIQVIPDGGTWVAGTTISLYGIKGA